MREEFKSYRYRPSLPAWSTASEAELAMSAPGVFSSLAPYAAEPVPAMAAPMASAPPMDRPGAPLAPAAARSPVGP
jgi:hypothetical protein